VFGGDVTAGTSLNITGSAGRDNFTTDGGNDTIDGGAGNDTIDGGNGNNTLIGGAGDDGITGGSGVDTITGGAGNDDIDGGSGADVIDGGAGDDTVDGTAGSTITLGTGNNELTTLEGTSLASTATITDFTFAALTAAAGGDTIDLSGAGNAAGSTVKGAAGNVLAAGVIADASTAAQAWTDGDVLFLNTETLASYDTAAEINTLFGAAAEFAALVNGEEFTLIISAEDTGHAYVWDLENNTAASTSLVDNASDVVNLVGILQNVGSDDLAAAAEANFIA
jgi:Ca2+-binding RTX toxin-like protein